MKAAAPGLHMLHGDSAASSWRSAFEDDDRVRINRDILSCGPMLAQESMTDWHRMRNGYLTQLHPQREARNYFQSDVELTADLQLLEEFETAYIWAGASVEDCLFVLFCVQLLSTHSHAECFLIQYGAREGLDCVWSIGLLRSDQILDHPTPSRLSQSFRDACCRAWTAYTSPDPESFVDCLQGDASELASLTPRLMTLLKRYPSRSSGLMLWDMRLLENVSKYGPKAASVIGHTLAEGYEDGDLVGDLYLFHRLLCMHESQNTSPLLELRGATTSIRDTDVELTEFGKLVVDGQACAHPKNPIDEWVGGVHLSSTEKNLWSFEEGRLVRW